MKDVLILTVTCPDKPGIVERISKTLLPDGANWEESWMGRLGGMFAGIIKVSVEEEKTPKLEKAILALGDDKMAVTVRRSMEDEPQKDYQEVELELSGADHEGIVNRVAQFLAERGVNVEKLQTSVAHAPLTGGPLFTAAAHLKCPPSLPLKDLREALEALALREAVDIAVEKK